MTKNFLMAMMVLLKGMSIVGMDFVQEDSKTFFLAAQRLFTAINEGSDDKIKSSAFFQTFFLSDPIKAQQILFEARDSVNSYLAFNLIQEGSDFYIERTGRQAQDQLELQRAREGVSGIYGIPGQRHKIESGVQNFHITQADGSITSVSRSLFEVNVKRVELGLSKLTQEELNQEDTKTSQVHRTSTKKIKTTAAQAAAITEEVDNLMMRLNFDIAPAKLQGKKGRKAGAK